MSESARYKPYVGLIPFHEEDAEFFFGREQEREIITSNLMASRLTLLYGASGVGKSSVLHAGVAHHLRALARRDIKRRGKPKYTVVVFSAWRDEPVKSLIEHVQKAVMITLEQPVEPVCSNLAFVESLREWSRRAQGQLLIILDQFEEYFLYHPSEDGEGTFAVEFSRAVNTPGLAANFIVSYREDAHAKLDFFKGRIPNLYENYLRIGHLGYHAARAAIKKPIERYNQLCNLDQKQSYIIQEQLVDAVLSQVRAGEKYIGETGRGVIGDKAPADDKSWEVETPYLQLVMTRLWETEVQNGSRVLQLETLNKLGGAKRIVQTHLDNAMSELSRKQQLMGANIFNYLVTPSGTKIAQTAHDLADYAKLPAAKEHELDQMMEKLTGGDSRILRSVPPPANQPNASRYEVFHDVLAQAILDWRRRFLARKDRMRLLRAVGIMAVVVLFMGVVTAYAWQQRNAAQENQRLAEVTASQNKKLAASNKELADKFELAYESERAAKSDADWQREKALEEAKAAEVAKAEAVRQKSMSEAAAKVALQEKAGAEAAKAEAVKQQGIAEAANLRYQTAEQKAAFQLFRAEQALATIDEIDIANAYSKTVMRRSSNVSYASFSPDETKALTISDDGAARIWDVNPKKKPIDPIHELSSDNGFIRSASFSPDGKLVVTVANEGEAIAGVATIWDVSGEKLYELDNLSIQKGRGDPLRLFGAAFMQNENAVIAYSEQDYRICKMNRSAGKLEECITHDVSGNLGQLFIEGISRDAKFLVLTGTDNLYSLLSVNTGTLIKLDQPSGDAARFVFSLEGKNVAIFNQGNTARVFDTATGGLVSELNDDALVTQFAFSPDSRLGATGNSKGSAKVWELTTKKLISSHSDHRGAITDVAFSPDKKYVVSASADKTARVWDVSDGRLFAELRGHIASVNSAAFAFTQEETFVLTSGDKTARVWDVTRRIDSGISKGEVSIHNGETFDLDGGSSYPNALLGSSGADLYWQHTVKRNSPGSSDLVTWALIPESKAQIAFFSGDKDAGERSANKRNFEEISVTELLGLNYSTTSITGGAVADRSGGEVVDPLPVDYIFAVLTSEGNYAKVQVVKRSTTLTIRWVTYKKPPSKS